MKFVDVKSSTYIESNNKEINNKDPKFKIDDIVRIIKNKNISVIGYTPNCFKEVFVIRKVKWFGNIFLMILIAKKLWELFTKKELQITNRKEFRIEKVIGRKDYKSYVK